jgi:hypothetical protein
MPSHLTLDPARFEPSPEKAGTSFGWRLETKSQGDPTAEGWTRDPADPNIQARLAHLREKNGLKGLQICHYSEVEKATKLFLRDGFVAVSDVLSPAQLEEMQQATKARNSHSNLHRQPWANLVDLPTTTPILTSIFGSASYWCWGAGGDFSLPGTYEYQNLHRDLGPGDFHDPTGTIQIWDLPPFSVTLNFPMVDFDNDVGRE